MTQKPQIIDPNKVPGNVEPGTIWIAACPECGKNLILRESRYGLFWGCTAYPACKTTQSAHGDTGKPTGTPADQETKEARANAFTTLQQLWQGPNPKTTKTKAYRWMRRVLNPPADTPHFRIGCLSKEQCELLIDKVGDLFLGKESIDETSRS